MVKENKATIIYQLMHNVCLIVNLCIIHIILTKLISLVTSL